MSFNIKTLGRENSKSWSQGEGREGGREEEEGREETVMIRRTSLAR